MEPQRDFVEQEDWTKFYPKNPENPPASLRDATTRYRIFIVAVIVALLLFCVLYIAMIVGSGWLVWWSWQGKPNLFLAFLSGMFFLFLIKGMFKSLLTRAPQEPEEHIEIDEQEHPIFFRFLQQLCLELGAPAPQRVFLSADTNAFVYWPRSLIQLFLPLQKELTVGAGLISALNLSEFKAVMAHELGHVGQKGLRTGIYIRMIQNTMQDMIWARDIWDRLLHGWLAIGYALWGGGIYGFVLGLVLLIPGWTLLLIVTVFRYFLGFLFHGISLLSAGLLRQAEYFADRIAVSVAGSDAICHSLLKLEFAEACSVHSLDELLFAAELGWVTDDIYLHQEAAGDYLRTLHDRPTWGKVPPGDEPLFSVDDEAEELSILSTHPTHWQREQNAKSVYVKAPVDTRSAWVLFSSDDVRQRLTQMFWQHRGDFSETAFRKAQDVQAFLEQDRQEREISPHYHGIYQGRLLKPDNFDIVAAQVRRAPLDDDALLKTFHALYNDSLENRFQALQKMQEELFPLELMMDGDAPMPSSSFLRGKKQQQQQELSNLFFTLRKTVEAELDWFGQVDTKVMQIHIQMAMELDSFVEDDEAIFLQELRERYLFHQNLQKLVEKLADAAQRMTVPLALLTGGSVELSQDEVDRIQVDLAGVFEAMVEVLDASETIKTVKLLGIEEGATLASILKANTPWKQREEELDESVEIELNLLHQLAKLQSKLNHMYEKSLGRLLAFQEYVAEEWQLYE